MNVFATNEPLYRRYRQKDMVKGQLSPAALQFPKQPNTGHSVNRGKFGKPADVLWNEKSRLEGYGVIQFEVACIGGELVCKRTLRRFSFIPKHVPVPKNYAHSEIWCTEPDQTGDASVTPTDEVKKLFRAQIAKNVKVVISAPG